VRREPLLAYQEGAGGLGDGADHASFSSGTQQGKESEGGDREAKMNIEKQQSRIIEEIDTLFGDTSVSQKTTLACLEEIQGEIDSKIEALKCDIRKAEQEAG
jgi:hypothetical protein